MFDNGVGSIAIPVIIGGIAGLTLSINAVQKIYLMVKDAYIPKDQPFFARFFYQTIVEDTYNLCALFFISEIVAVGGFFLDCYPIVLLALLLLIISSLLVIRTFDRARHIIDEKPPEVIDQYMSATEYADPEDLNEYRDRLIRAPP